MNTRVSAPIIFMRTHTYSIFEDRLSTAAARLDPMPCEICGEQSSTGAGSLSNAPYLPVMRGCTIGTLVAGVRSAFSLIPAQELKKKYV
jgi:hypothetical protein